MRRTAATPDGDVLSDATSISGDDRHETLSPKLPAILADDLGAAVPLLRILAGLG
jgi:hypothetical protein